MMTQIGLMIEGQWGLTWERWRRLLRAAEDYGYQCVFRSDHYTIGPPDQESLETFISLTYAATQTQRIEFGTLVAPTTFRHPAMTARMAAGIDDLSGGRMVLGLGTGWHEREHTQFGVPFHDMKTRFEMLEDALELTTRLYKSDEPIDWVGKHYWLKEAILLPRPHRPGGPSILIGGNGMKKTLPLVAKYADEWNAVHRGVEEVKERNILLDELLKQNGRKPADVKRSLMIEVVYGETDEELEAKRARINPDDHRNRLIGTGSAIVDYISQYVEAGVERVMLMWAEQDDIGGLEKMARDVLPHFHT
ncbi:MAG: TIGR03560 family F420-dependent LLM class oxidoreductase [Anaerolineae bacterium]|nr:TIGR03560 family F420-dependent LLM class oxidoreductase [Anaerolineae bacterium]